MVLLRSQKVYMISLFSVPILTSLDVVMTNLDSDLFPGMGDDLMVHSGFADEHAKYVKLLEYITLLISGYRTAEDVLDAVKTTLGQRQTSKVTVVGHSLGLFVCVALIYLG